MSIIQFGIVLIAFLTSALAVDYIFTWQEDGVTACPGSEHLFLDAYFDYSNLDIKQLDEEEIKLHGYVIFLKKLDPSLQLHIAFQKLTSGRWVDSALQIDRPDVCKVVFDKNEIWYDVVKELEANSKLCPPEPGTKYDFNNKKLSTVLRNATPGMQGTYRALVKVFSGEKQVLCMFYEGDLVKKNLKL